MASRTDAVAAPRSATKAERGSNARARLGHPDTLIGLICCSLVVLGLIMILSASSVTSFANYGSSFLFFKRQLLWAAIGVCGYFTLSRFDYTLLRGLGYLGFVVSLGLLACVLVPGVGVVAGGSARWLNLGPFSFQPSEVAKLGLVLFAADVFARKKERSFDDFLHTSIPLIPALGALTLLVILQPDLGTAVLLGVIGIGALFVAGAPMRYIVPICFGGAAAAGAAALSADYRRARLLAFLDPWSDPLNTGYQTIQSLIALGSGGWFGLGLGASRQKWAYIPNAHTDFIFAILGEEMGLLGTLSVVAMFAFLTYLGIQTARRAPDRFGMLIASGITIWVGVQAIVNIGAVSAALPITGVPLPLVSFGGTSLVISLLAMGILTNIARQANGRPATGRGSRSAPGRAADRGSGPRQGAPRSGARKRKTTAGGTTPAPVRRTTPKKTTRKTSARKTSKRRTTARTGAPRRTSARGGARRTSSRASRGHGPRGA